MGRRLVLIVATLLFLYVASPLLLPMAMGGVLGVLFVPVLQRLERRKISTELGSAFLTFVITVVILLPLSILLFIGVKTAVQQLQGLKDAPKGAGGDWVSAILNESNVQRLLVGITRWFPARLDELIETADTVVRSVGGKLAELLGGSLAAVPGTVMGLIVVVVSVYFTLSDGKRLLAFVRRNSVFSAGQTERLIHSLALMCRGVILATVLSGAAQAIVEGTICLLLGVPNVELIITLVFLGSFIPIVGATPVTLGVASQQFLVGNNGAGIALLITAVVVAGIDNVVRPLFLKGSGGLHPMFAFVSAFGGLQTLGFLGVFLGPIIASLFVFTLEVVIEGPDRAVDSIQKDPV